MDNQCQQTAYDQSRSERIQKKTKESGIKENIIVCDPKCLPIMDERNAPSRNVAIIPKCNNDFSSAFLSECLIATYPADAQLRRCAVQNSVESATPCEEVNVLNCMLLINAIET